LSGEPVPRPCRVVLMGMMGSGKSTVGRLLAARTGWPYHDNDELLGRLAGATPRAIEASAGEDAMRVAESAALRLGLEQPPPCLIGAAAGTILDADNRELLDSAVVVWLRALPATLAERSKGSSHRPWLATGALAWLSAADSERRPLYESVAYITVDVDELTPEATASAVLDELRLQPACRAALSRSASAGG
jgi:shikimate kinase